MQGIPEVTPATNAWRAMARKMGFPVKESDAERLWRTTVKYMNQPLSGPVAIGCTAPKGGGAKTTTAIAIAIAISRLRQRARVCAVDTDPHGDLILRSEGVQSSNILSFAEAIMHGDERRPNWMAHTVDGVDILGAAPSLLDEPLTAEAWERVLNTLRARYDVIIVDMAVINHDRTYQAVLRSLDSLIITSPPTAAGTRLLAQIPYWLDKQGAGHLKGRRMTLISTPDPLPDEIDVDELRRLARTERVEAMRVPFDPHLRAATNTAFDDLSAETRKAFVVAAGTAVKISS